MAPPGESGLVEPGADPSLGGVSPWGGGGEPGSRTPPVAPRPLAPSAADRRSGEEDDIFRSRRSWWSPRRAGGQASQAGGPTPRPPGLPSPPGSWGGNAARSPGRSPQLPLALAFRCRVLPRRLLPGEGGPLGHPGSPTPLRAASSLGSKDSVLRISGLEGEGKYKVEMSVTNRPPLKTTRCLASVPPAMCRPQPSEPHLLLWGDSFCGTFLFLMSFSMVFPCRRPRDGCDFRRPGHLLSKACSRLKIGTVCWVSQVG